ncbi:MAG: hypothetical protein V8S04_00945 [Clostridia bacterium]
MPTYMYKAATKSGLVVRNKVEASSKQSLIKALKGNNLLPIDVEQLTYRTNKKKTKKKNITDIQEIMKNVNTTQLGQPKQKTLSTKERINLYLKKSEKITQRDLVIFTQNFYLLKKADFNNIHALRTIIEGTENISFRGVLEDILSGVEARRNNVHNNGILFKYISIYIYKYDKSWRTFRFTYKFFETSCRILR